MRKSLVGGVIFYSKRGLAPNPTTGEADGGIRRRRAAPLGINDSFLSPLAWGDTAYGMIVTV
jgi:hypothetical protein